MARLGLNRRHGVGPRPDGLPDIDWVHMPRPQPFIYQKSTHAGLPAFDIARYPITNAQFQSFIDAGAYRDTRWWEGLAERIDTPAEPEWDEPNSPRETVSWYEAVAFCRWLSDATGQTVTLPTEEQWERTARGLDGREYPWGPFDDAYANCQTSSDDGRVPDVERSSAVGLYPQGATPEGVLDLAGNVWEWCLNEYDNPAMIGLGGDQSLLLRGGSWNFDPGYCRADYREEAPPDDRFSFIGFRVCRGSPIDPREAASLGAFGRNPNTDRSLAARESARAHRPR